MIPSRALHRPLTGGNNALHETQLRATTLANLENEARVLRDPTPERGGTLASSAKVLVHRPDKIGVRHHGSR